MCHTMRTRSYLFLFSDGGRAILLVMKEKELSTNPKLLAQRELLPDNRRNWAWNQGKLVSRRIEESAAFRRLWSECPSPSAGGL